MARVRSRAAVVGMVLIGLFGLTGCDDEASDEPSSQATTQGHEDVDDNSTPGNETEQGTAHDGVESAPALPADLPEGFPRIGVPFYQPAELVASPSLGDPWVLEFVTDHELTIVNNTIADEFSQAHGWHQVSRHVEGQRTVTQGNKDGYHLVIAVAPERQDDFKTSLYYTLSTQ